MEKFFKVLRKIIKILLKILLGTLIFFVIIIILFNNRHFKLYDGYKITFNESKNINNGYEIYYNLKDLNVMFNEFKKGCINGETIIDYELSKNTKIITIINTGYYENGNIMAKLNMTGININGEKTSVSNLYRYYKNGKLNIIQNEKNGVLDGKFFEYYENGNIKEEGFYIDGEKIGIWTGYNEDGNISYSYNYDNGELVENNYKTKEEIMNEILDL